MSMCFESWCQKLIGLLSVGLSVPDFSGRILRRMQGWFVNNMSVVFHTWIKIQKKNMQFQPCSLLLASTLTTPWSSHTNVVGCCLSCLKYLYSTPLASPGHSWWAVWLILCTTCQPVLQFVYNAIWVGGGDAKWGRGVVVVWDGKWLAAINNWH